MQKKLIQEFYKELVSYLTDKQFLKSVKLSKKAMLELLQSDYWNESIKSVFDKEKVECKDVLKICENALTSISVEPEEGWLNYIYDSILHQLFPENSTAKRVHTYEEGKLFYLEVLRCFLLYEADNKPFNPRSHMTFLSEDEIEKSDTAEEYRKLLQIFHEQYIYEFMRIGSEITRYKTLQHIAGVHYISMHVGRQLLSAMVPIDIALVSGAAVGHDIGKYGCKPEEVKRIPYLHYYYTDRYFKSNKMPNIGHIATNHSTWDLELENLSVESLVLIYADFRVKSVKGPDGKEFVNFFNLDESFNVILSKLDNVDAAKKDRYTKVYAKLKDFEDYMIGLGVNTDLTTAELRKPEKKDTALFNSGEVVRSLKHLAIQHNIFVMHKLNSETTFADILEAARSEKDWENIRAYINIFQEYFTYMTQKQKILTLDFLYELLMHKEGDIRRQSADLIGNIIVHFDEEFRKELPEGAHREPGETTSLNLWEKYLNLVISPDPRVIDQHKRWIGYTLKLIVSSALGRCKDADIRKYLDLFLKYYINTDRNDLTAFILLDSILMLPLDIYTCDDKIILMNFTGKMIEKESLEVKIAALRFVKYLSEDPNSREEMILPVKEHLNAIDSNQEISIAFLKYKIRTNLELKEENEKSCETYLYNDPGAISEIFLENLKAATPWVIKSVNIELLLEQIKKGTNKQILQVAAHLSNLVKASERVAVRHSAGQALLTIIPLLTLTQKNEIAVELSKGLEIGAYEFSKYIPEYLGQIALQLHPEELDELILDFKKLMNSNSDRVCSVTLDTLGVLLQNHPAYQDRFGEEDAALQKRREVILGLILKGLSNYHGAVSEEAFLVIGQYFFGTPKLSLKDKYDIFSVIYKKMLTLITDQKETELSFFNSAASLNHIYRFLLDYLFSYGDFNLPEAENIAFFPSSFDPFSLGHKGIINAVRNLGFETYLAIDEFSWSRKTQPKMIRRKIISMSIADEKDVFLFPDDIPINIANPCDLKRLKELLPRRQIFIVVGSDVIRNASSYQAQPRVNSIHSFPHIIFRHSDSVEKMNSAGAVETKKYPMISGEIKELILPANLEEINPLRIRDNIDHSRDIANLIDPLVQTYIYDNSLYLREPPFKHIFSARRIHFEVVEQFDKELTNEVMETIFKNYSEKDRIKSYLLREGTKAVIIRDGEKGNLPVGIATFHEISMADLYAEFGMLTVASYIRRITSGKIIILTGVAAIKETFMRNPEQLALTEALAYCLQNNFTYAIFHSHLGEVSKDMISLLERQGFLAIKENPSETIFAVDMKVPVTLFRDIETNVKYPFNQRTKVLNAIEEAHKKLQSSIAKLYPGNLILSIDARVINHRIVDMITNVNQVRNEQLPVRELGEYMCVPFGKILRGLAVPNTVTKALHTEKMFEPKINRFKITEFPYYSPLITQIRTIKSFHKPVLLVDDLIHKGYRMKELDPILKKEKVEVNRIIVGILSGRGKNLMELQNRKVDSVYFIPNLRSWFDESSLYPFIGGDGVRRDQKTNAGIIPSVNLILPYVAPNFLMDVPKDALYDFSMVCLENAKNILTALEDEFQSVYERNLTLNRLSEAIISPRYPDKGLNMSYDLNLAPSVYIVNDIENLVRLENLVL